MTLHWWMHWFWVTAQIVVSLTSPTSERTPSPTEGDSSLPSTSNPEATRMQYTTETLARLQQSYRIAKAIGIQPTMNSADAAAESLGQSVTTDAPPPPRNLQQQQQQFGRFATTEMPPGYERTRSSPSPLDSPTAQELPENKPPMQPSSQPGRIPGKKETKITWVHAFSKPPRLKQQQQQQQQYDPDKTSVSPSPLAPVSSEPTPEELLTVMPLREAVGAQDPNAIRREQLQMAAAGANRSDEGQLLGEETAEPHVVATAASVLEAGLADSTRLGRARGTFTSEFQRDQLSRDEHHTEGKEEAIKETAETSANVTEIATITGSCLAIIILLSTVGSLGFVMYRRRYLNPPQTLNSDKCSNPDSSGYIDDSTIRDNSEEMYSLDNDSFLNSLEAMTIQNYWTDSVKHTKL